MTLGLLWIGTVKEHGVSGPEPLGSEPHEDRGWREERSGSMNDGGGGEERDRPSRPVSLGGQADQTPRLREADPARWQAAPHQP